MRQRIPKVAFLVALTVATAVMMTACADKVPLPQKLSRITVENQNFRDAEGRYLMINGVNVSGTSKVPVSISPISYVGRPFPLDEVDGWFEKLRHDGFNAIRLLATWESVCHEAPGVYDEEYLDYFEQVVSKANDHGIYVLINFHENLFSRHIYQSFNDNPSVGAPGSMEGMIASLFPVKNSVTGKLEYDSKVVGDGAPRWAVEACLPEKDLDSPSYGMMRILGNLTLESGNLGKLVSAFTTLLGGGGGGDMSSMQALLDVIASNLSDLTVAELIPFDITQTNDMLPFTLWALNSFLSSDVEKCYAAFFAGNEVFPGRKVGDVPVMDYLQQGHIDAWLEVVKRVKKYDNVIGYDLMNEPTGVFVILSVLSAYVSAGFDNTVAYNTVVSLIGGDTADAIYNIIDATGLLPSVPLDLTEENVAAKVTQPLVDVLHNAVEPRLVVLLDSMPIDVITNKVDITSAPFKSLVANAITDAQAEARIKGLAKVSSMEEGLRESILGDLNSAVSDVIRDAVNKSAAAINLLPPEVLADEKSQAALMIKIEEKNNAFEAAAPAITEAVAAVRKQQLVTYWEGVKAQWGLADFDLFASLDLNMNLERKYMMRYWNRIGAAIQEEDPNAIMWVGDPLGLSVVLGGEGMAQTNSAPYKPENIKQMVHAYHWYAGSIYPLGLFQVPPQKFTASEWQDKDFLTPIAGKYARTKNTYGNVPVVFTEFGTYFNFNWDLKDLESIYENINFYNYDVSAVLLNKYYESFEELMSHKMVWCMSGDNDYQLGDLWNHEDFSIYGPDGQPRGQDGWLRTTVLLSAGEPIETHFFSNLHRFDPDKGESIDMQLYEFYFACEGKESSAPTEIFVPEDLYPTGFYVWLSDGWAEFDPVRQTLYHYPTNDDAAAKHEITIRRPAQGRYNDGWSYFFEYTGRKVVGDLQVGGANR